MTRRLLVTDLDNTLWDWFTAWHQSFTALLDTLVATTGADRDQLIGQIRRVHQRHGSVEYPNLVYEVPLLTAAAGAGDPSAVFTTALRAQQQAREDATRLYPHVRDGLDRLCAAGVRIVAYTDAPAPQAIWRIRHTGLDGVIDTLYAPDDQHLARQPDAPGGQRHPQPGRLSHTRQRPVARSMRKPHPATLGRILADHACDPADAVYLGDSLTKDMPMAQAAGVTDVHAAYGMFQHRDGYQLLRQVSSWPDADVTRDTDRARRRHDDDTVTSTVVCHRGFTDLLPLFGLPDS